MSNQRSQKPAGRRKGNQPGRNRMTGAVVLALAAALVFGGIVAYAMSSGDDESAGATAGTESVRVLDGAPHTVQHSLVSLPTGGNPATNSLPTLVWFSGTWCHFCYEMEPFAYETAATFAGRLNFVEKSVDHDRDAVGRYGVRGTPTFVLIDAKGEEIARFGFQDDAEAFAAAIEKALGATGA